MEGGKKVGRWCCFLGLTKDDMGRRMAVSNDMFLTSKLWNRKLHLRPNLLISSVRLGWPLRLPYNNEILDVSHNSAGSAIAANPPAIPISQPQRHQRDSSYHCYLPQPVVYSGNQPTGISIVHPFGIALIPTRQSAATVNVFCHWTAYRSGLRRNYPNL